MCYSPLAVPQMTITFILLLRHTDSPHAPVARATRHMGENRWYGWRDPFSSCLPPFHKSFVLVWCQNPTSFLPCADVWGTKQMSRTWEWSLSVLRIFCSSSARLLTSVSSLFLSPRSLHSWITFCCLLLMPSFLFASSSSLSSKAEELLLLARCAF